MTVLSRTSISRFALLAVGAAAALAVAAQAQDAAPQAQQGAIVIPDNVTIFGKNDPNVRKEIGRASCRERVCLAV